jgi:hypothetical protein
MHPGARPYIDADNKPDSPGRSSRSPPALLWLTHLDRSALPDLSLLTCLPV